MIELQQLFQDLERIVYEQEPLVEKIEQQAETVQEDLVKGNEEMTHAVTSARAARKKKWICLGIVGKFFWFLATVGLETSGRLIGASSYHCHHHCRRSRLYGCHWQAWWRQQASTIKTSLIIDNIVHSLHLPGLAYIRLFRY